MFIKLSCLLIFAAFVSGCVTNDGVQRNNSKSKKTKISTELEEDKIFAIYQEVSKSRGSVVDLKVDYSGEYNISQIDEHLMKTYHRRYVYKTYNNKKRTYTLPAYDYLKMKRAGPNWSISVEERLDGSFKIEGINSKGIKMDKSCKPLRKCFELL